MQFTKQRTITVETFTCLNCSKEITSKNSYFINNSVDVRICNGCYGETLLNKL